MAKVTNILLAGVGGQGILLASEVLSEVLMLAGFDVKKNEVHGMSQRGGSVVSHVRFGEKVYSPIIPEGQADILFGFELLETYRYLPFLQANGKIVVNRCCIMPPAVATGLERYPENLAELLGAAVADVRIVEGHDLAVAAGNPRTVNTVLLGALSNSMAVDSALWTQALETMVPKKFLAENMRAFELGRQNS